MEKKVNYCGSGKKQKDNWLKATINIEKIKPFIEEYNGVKFVKLNINIKDEADQYGKDVSISIDDWKPETSVKENAKKLDSVINDEKDDLPF